MAEALPCATLSRALTEPLYGTASRVRGWVLLEQPGPWGREAVTESRLDRDLARALDGQARDAHLRLLLIRRPGRPTQGGLTTCFVAHTSRQGRWLERRRLEDPAELLALDMAAVVAGRRPGFGEEVVEPVYLVCTNGRHDRCCATYGRPLALALAASHGDLIWESSHVGGDRFAGNLVCLPDGHYFGRVGPDDAARVVDRHRRGALDLDHYRGCCIDPPVVQAAEWFARRHTGLLGAGDLDLLGRERLAGDVAAVRFARAGGGQVRVLVGADRTADPRILTCHSPRPEAPLGFTLLELSEAPGPGGR
ncbi:MAG TPA: sucrase ferredoxin [Actinomycetota bacterium]|nr:sucrase ferredoxin [Actinomycetota bacterium]